MNHTTKKQEKGEIFAKDKMIYRKDGKTMAVFYEEGEAESLINERNEMKIMIEKLRYFIMNPAPNHLGLIMDESKKFTF